jgi:hypothetical protein
MTSSPPRSRNTVYLSWLLPVRPPHPPPCANPKVNCIAPYALVQKLAILFVRGRKGGALELAEKLECAVILSIDSLAAAQDGQKLGPRKGSACFRGPRLSLGHRGRAADLKNRSALHVLNLKDLRVEFLQRSSGDEESRIALKMLRARSFAPLRMTALQGFSAACKVSPFRGPRIKVLNNGIRYLPHLDVANCIRLTRPISNPIPSPC